MRPIAFDVTRLLWRLGSRTPNGMDRVDIAYARHFAGRPGLQCVATLPGIGALSIDPSRLAAVADRLEARWGENGDPGADAIAGGVHDWLAGRAPATPAPDDRSSRAGPNWTLGDMVREIARFARRGVLQTRPAAAGIARDAVYLSVGQFPLWLTGAYGWLARRPDVRPVFFVHDLLPLDYPRFFEPHEQERHAARMRTVARHAGGAIVTTRAVADRLARHLEGLGALVPPTLVAPLPPGPEFRPGAGTPPPGARPYLVVCGTVEPRKNHRLLLDIWAGWKDRPDAPLLVVAGKAGWENAEVLALLRSGVLDGTVRFAPGLTTPALRDLMAGARALLMPSIDEGYGLPVVEALALGTPVIASDVPALQEASQGCALHLPAERRTDWEEAIREVGVDFSPLQRRVAALARGFTTPDAAGYFRQVDAFLDGND